MKKVLYGVLAIVTLFSLAGCGNKEKEEAKVVPSESNVEQTRSTEEIVQEAKDVVEELPEETVAGYQEALQDIQVTSDNNKLVFQQGENMTAVYYHDGTKITGYEAYIDYDSPELAHAAKIEADKEKEDDVESIKVEGSRIVVKFKESAYEDTTLEELKQSYAVIQALQGKE